MKDDARAFNPLTVPEADVTTPLDEKTAGGLGIHLMRKVMDEIEYHRMEDGNLLIMKKNFRHNNNQAKGVSTVPGVPACAGLAEIMAASAATITDVERDFIGSLPVSLLGQH